MTKRYIAVPFNGTTSAGPFRRTKWTAIRDAKRMPDTDAPCVGRLPADGVALECVWRSRAWHTRRTHEAYLHGLRMATCVIPHDSAELGALIERAKTRALTS